ncbi:TonB-dependent receptor [Aurantiacibacter suaedae]|uniref:TonB-dependent receptor n=1 Tax=Aurantiacibacter suaedae TaxID=2545755 RepID=UPI0010F5D790|nr:TonB-dependent receptor [Aurantiacibacter suaedae]
MHPIYVRPVVAVCAIALATPVAAQESALPGSNSEASSPSTESATASDDDIILVNARRRSESAQQVPIAISVIGGRKLDDLGAFNVQRLQQISPSLNFFSSNPRNTAVNIRGIGVPFGLTNDGFDQGVGLYVDDVYFSRIASATLDFLDVAQIEVLRGPQGTLYGKNTTAGAINITTRRPTFTFEGRGELSVGNLGFTQAKASISGPVSDTVAARFALSSTDRRGTIFNTTSGNYINEQDNLGLRAQVLWEPADNLEVLLAGDYTDQNPECCAQIYVGTGLTQRPLNRQYAALAAAQNYQVPSENPFDRVTDVDANLNARNRIGGVSLRAQLDTAFGTLTSITAWRAWDWLPENDRDFTGLPITIRSQNPSQQDQWTQEFRFSHEGDRIGFLLGAFAFEQKVRTQGTQEQGPAASRWLLNPSSPLADDPTVLDGLTATNDIQLNNTSLALFGQLTWKVTDSLSLQPGFRVNYDRKKGLYESVVTNGDGQLVTSAETDPRIVAQRGVLAPQRFEPEFSDWNFSYDLTASYQLTDDILAYATYAKTFKPGGINLNGVPTDAAGSPILAVGSVRPETVNHYEAGLKTQFAARVATLNLSLFRTDIDDYQAQVVNGQLGVLRGYLANAEKVRTQGAEFDFEIRPSERFNAYLGGAFTDATYLRFTDAPCPPELSGGTTVGTGQTPGGAGVPGSLSPANCDISGEQLPGVSKWSITAGLEGSLPLSLLARAGELYLGMDGSWRARLSSNPTPSAYTWIEGYALANLRFGFRNDDGLNAFVWVRNVLDEDYFEQLAVPSGNTGLIVGQPADPRTYGLTLAYEF